VKEGVTDALGASVAVAMFDQMYEHYDLTLENLPDRLDTFFSVLEDAFGYKLSRVLSRVIARKLYAQLSLEFAENPEKGLLEYVEEARNKLANL
jgi:hypothetical protein